MQKHTAQFTKLARTVLSGSLRVLADHLSLSESQFDDAYYAVACRSANRSMSDQMTEITKDLMKSGTDRTVAGLQTIIKQAVNDKVINSEPLKVLDAYNGKDVLSSRIVDQVTMAMTHHDRTQFALNYLKVEDPAIRDTLCRQQQDYNNEIIVALLEMWATVNHPDGDGIIEHLMEIVRRAVDDQILTRDSIACFQEDTLTELGPPRCKEEDRTLKEFDQLSMDDTRRNDKGATSSIDTRRHDRQKREMKVRTKAKVKTNSRNQSTTYFANKVKQGATLVPSESDDGDSGEGGARAERDTHTIQARSSDSDGSTTDSSESCPVEITECTYEVIMKGFMKIPSVRAMFVIQNKLDDLTVLKALMLSYVSNGNSIPTAEELFDAVCDLEERDKSKNFPYSKREVFEELTTAKSLYKVLYSLGTGKFSESKKHETSEESEISDVASLEAERMELDEKVESIREANQCKVCMIEDADIVCLPCAHISSCHDCTERLEKCPICRMHIQATVHAYIT